MSYRIMLSKETGNLGDMLQAVALSRLLGEAIGFYRDHKHLNPPADQIGVAAGFMLGPNGEDPSRLLFCGIYWLPTADNVKWLKRSPYHIGARDRETYEGLKGRGVATELIGCATLTLPRYDGVRSGEISVDFDGPGERLTHHVSKWLTTREEWALCLETLEKYRTAKAVYTTRLHVALPCVAMGTPVCYTGPEEGRTTILHEIGLKRGTLSLPDVSKWRERYIAFLRRNLGGNLDPLSAPVFPQIHEVPVK